MLQMVNPSPNYTRAMLTEPALRVDIGAEVGSPPPRPGRFCVSARRTARLGRFWRSLTKTSRDERWTG
jgi:hypothetical protein